MKAKRLLGLLLLVLAACFPVPVSPDVIAGELIAQGANAALPLIVSEYQRQGDREIALAKSRVDGEMRLRVIRELWHPVFAAWIAFAGAHAVWSDAVRHGKVPSREKLEQAYCNLVAVWPASVPLFPVTGVQCVVPALPGTEK